MTSDPLDLKSHSTPQSDSQLSAYQYELPAVLIAQNPVTPRDSARLLVVNRHHHQHRHFYDLSDLLRPHDLLILNNTRVIPARLFGKKQSGGVAEVLLIEPKESEATGERRSQRWLALVKPGRRLQPGSVVIFGSPDNPVMRAYIETRDDATNGRIVRLEAQGEHAETPIEELIDQLGQVPLPPYITKSESLPAQYQTVFAERKGAIAAPTAGLHFTQRLLSELSDKGIQTAEITLHVGIGTFRPVEVKDIKTHQMHEERIEVSPETVEKIRQTKAKGGRVIALGTTSTRALEGAAAACGELQPFNGRTNIFIYPGYQWKVIDGLITNFHLPESSLLMMVSALIGRERLMAIYEDAIAQKYRFYSFGDAMLILPEAAIE
ncbi:MAG: tRNA preQ1(34) S-adenosylmethionine ribosyltransferase-isomerase QueA [Leptolyngbya foveolarum]|uniref:S-adenosylmethionine:tRNA ribosyltransferase-isomerase n=1 Tax=Leptolyngbya foveolarum TaxID=47253 RepID=A0A2W4W4Y5_9CYAN|nr:MAG: tRNA preQ1(34) S-adenosylmethionine ribosyltransferase-isomerase QueA [Leptolyngbya foveolarum]